MLLQHVEPWLMFIQKLLFYTLINTDFQERSYKENLKGMLFFLFKLKGFFVVNSEITQRAYFDIFFPYTWNLLPPSIILLAASLLPVMHL